MSICATSSCQGGYSANGSNCETSRTPHWSSHTHQVKPYAIIRDDPTALTLNPSSSWLSITHKSDRGKSRVMMGLAGVERVPPSPSPFPHCGGKGNLARHGDKVWDIEQMDTITVKNIISATPFPPCARSRRRLGRAGDGGLMGHPESLPKHAQKIWVMNSFTMEKGNLAQQ
jgi:hypothetical protein